MKYLLTVILFSFIVFNIHGQNKKTPPALVPIERDVLSGLNIPRMKLREHPKREYFQKQLFRGEDLSVFILSSETANNKIPSFPIEEFVYFANGKADVTMKSGNTINFLKGDYIMVPKGFAADWKNIGGSKYHLELSVISTKRSPKGKVSESKLPELLNREKLAGVGLGNISKSGNKEALYSGIELEMFTFSERAGTKRIRSLEGDEFINVLSGKVTVTSNSGFIRSFYAGDFFVLRKGFTGTWKTEGTPFRSFRVRSVL